MSQSELLKDFQKIRKKKDWFDDARVVSRFARDDVTDFRIAVLPVHGYFRNCLVRFSLKFNNFPNEKPKAKCLTNIFHPNIATSGNICYTLFDEHWSKDYRLADYINGLLYLLAQPNPDSPLNSNCVEKDKKKYDELVQLAAKGETSKGHMYDYCYVTSKLNSSMELGKVLDELIAFLDRKRIPFEMEKKINDFYAKIQNVESESMRLFIKFIGFSEELNKLCNILKTFGGETMSDFDSKKFVEEQKKCEWFLKKVDRVFIFELKMDTFLEQVVKKFKDKQSRVFKSFDGSFDVCRKIVDKLYDFIDTDEGFSKDSKVCEDMISLFIEKAKLLFDVERKIFDHYARIKQKFGNQDTTILKLFENEDLKILENIATQFYDEKFLNMDEENEKFLEGLKLLNDILKNSETIFNSEILFFDFHKKLMDDFGKREGYGEDLKKFEGLKKSIRDCLDEMHGIVKEENSKLSKSSEIFKKLMVTCTQTRDGLDTRLKRELEEKKKLENLNKNKEDEEDEIKIKRDRRKLLKAMLEKKKRILEQRRNLNRE